MTSKVRHHHTNVRIFRGLYMFTLALLGGVLAEVGAVEELPVEELDADDGEDELEEHVDHEDVEHVLQRDDDAVEDGLQLGDAVDRL